MWWCIYPYNNDMATSKFDCGDSWCVVCLCFQQRQSPNHTHTPLIEPVSSAPTNKSYCQWCIHGYGNRSSSHWKTCTNHREPGHQHLPVNLIPTRHQSVHWVVRASTHSCSVLVWNQVVPRTRGTSCWFLLVLTDVLNDLMPVPARCGFTTGWWFM